MERKRLYKVLTKDMISPIQSFKYELGKEYKCKDFDSNPNIDCSRGFYATDIDGLPYSFDIHRKVFEVEVWGKAVELNQFKQRYEYIKLIREVPHEEVKKLAREWEPRVGYKLSELLFPVNPFEITPPEIMEKHKELLNDWILVKDFVEDSVEASVGDLNWGPIWFSVGDLTRDLIWDTISDLNKDSFNVLPWGLSQISVRNSVWDSVADSIWAYVGSLFPEVKKWKYISHESDKYPFQPAVDLWYQGLVPSFDGKVWRLHGGENGEVLYTHDVN